MSRLPAAEALSWRRVLALLHFGALLLIAIPTPLPAADNVTRRVVIPGKLFEPERLEVLLGENVTWQNFDAATHTVTADNGSFDSGDLKSEEEFSKTFTEPGRTIYHCAIHRFMTGEIDVFAIGLSGPFDPVTVGGQFSLHGLAAPGTDVVTVQRRNADGEFVKEVAAIPSEDGRFSVSLVAVTSADYRAVAGALASPLVHVGVSPHIALTAHRAGRRVRIAAFASPEQPGMPGVLEVYSRERFDWSRFARVRFDARSRVHLTLRPQRRLDLRLVLLHATAGFQGGTSNVVPLLPPR